jgi:predicted NBD/HSP70 family sugar kinase
VRLAVARQGAAGEFGHMALDPHIDNCKRAATATAATASSFAVITKQAYHRVLKAVKAHAEARAHFLVGSRLLAGVSREAIEKLVPIMRSEKHQVWFPALVPGGEHSFWLPLPSLKWHPTIGCQIGTKCPILHFKQDQVHPIGFSDAGLG